MMITAESHVKEQISFSGSSRSINDAAYLLFTIGESSGMETWSSLKVQGHLRLLNRIEEDDLRSTRVLHSLDQTTFVRDP